MLIDVSIVILVSVLYYLTCSLSRILNLIGGVLLVYLLCWAVGVNVAHEALVSEIEFVVIVIVINVWMAIHSHNLIDESKTSRMSKFHHHHSNHVYATRNRLNNFHLKGISDHFKATPEVYLQTIKTQLDKINKYVSQHSDYNQFNQLIKSLQVIQAEIDDINYHLDLPMQVNFPHGLKRLIHQYYIILHEYHVEEKARNQEMIIADVFSHGAKNPAKKNVFLHVNLRFPYQRLIHDRITHQIDLLVINSKGVFAFTLLDNVANPLIVNRNDEIASGDIKSKRYHNLQSVINLKNELNVNYDAVEDLIPHHINVIPRVGVICTDPKVTIQLKDPKFKMIKPQQIDSLMAKLPEVLTPGQVHDVANAFRDCFTRSKKYEWHVFDTRTQSIISSLLWYQDQVKSLDHKLIGY
ncbi:hypothetical protein [Acetilactobacillus jinshanensis]|uniref:NERD domain-containing protein n=1 Tax=Acetilactobacillus jinshanensis TaxID=1720083 RepID=A0A4P6ZL35_9LACO|nr:hypothetical protein [Acetilactobacillus jinshanensis]QBP18535.1 hypothetical protein ELX58_05185 [Acetilactobacillus jinshanensis]URL61408.1 hypothetical protein HGK75_05310 [uncultured bacterium]